MTLAYGQTIDITDLTTPSVNFDTRINAYRNHSMTHAVFFTGEQGEDFYFTPDDDYELLGFYAMETEAGNVTVSIDTEDGSGNQDLTPILDLNLTKSHTASAAGTWSMSDIRDSTGNKFFMLKGVTHRLRITTATDSAAIVLALNVKIRPHLGKDVAVYAWEDNDTVTPSNMNAMYSKFDEIIRKTRKARFFTHPFNLRFKAVNSSTDEGLRKFHFTNPGNPADIAAIDIAISGYSGSEETASYTVSLLQGATSYGSVTIDGPDSDFFTNQISRLTPATSSVDDDQEYTILVESTATNARDIHLTVHLRTNVRLAPGTGAAFSYTPVLAGGAVDSYYIDQALTAWNQAATDLTSQSPATQIDILEVNDADISGGVKWAIPGIPGRSLRRVELYGNGVSTTLECDILDEAGAAVGTNPRQLFISGATTDLDGPTTDNSPADGQMVADADLADTSDDFTVELSTLTSVTLNRAMVVLYWTMAVP